MPLRVGEGGSAVRPVVAMARLWVPLLEHSPRGEEPQPGPWGPATQCSKQAWAGGPGPHKLSRSTSQLLSRLSQATKAAGWQ